MLFSLCLPFLLTYPFPGDHHRHHPLPAGISHHHRLKTEICSEQVLIPRQLRSGALPLSHASLHIAPQLSSRTRFVSCFFAAGLMPFISVSGVVRCMPLLGRIKHLKDSLQRVHGLGRQSNDIHNSKFKPPNKGRPLFPLPLSQ